MPTRKRRFSLLTLRVLAVNALALAVLAGSLLYVGRYKDRLIDTELEAVALEARIFAAAMAEGATIMNRDGNDILAPSLARQMVRRLAEASDAQTKLFASSGALIADSRNLGHPGGRIQVEPLTPEQGDDADQISASQKIWHTLWPVFVLDTDGYPVYPDRDNPRAEDFPEVVAAREGSASTRVWRTAKGALVLSAATPVQRYKEVLGMLNLTRDGTKIESDISAVQIDILKIFFATLSVTTLLSFYLARAITRPIWHLANAAERVRGGLGRDQEIPDFTARSDEIGDLSGALRAMTQTLWARLDAIEHFAADVAHEIKNPLTSMRSAIETIERVREPEVRERLLRIVLDDIDRLDRLISDISSASRLDAELSRAEMHPVDLDQLLATLVDFYQPRRNTGNNGASGGASGAGGADSVAPEPVRVRYARGDETSPDIVTHGAGALAAPLMHDGSWDSAASMEPDQAAQGPMAQSAPDLPSLMPMPLRVNGVESRLAQVFRNLIDNAVSFSPPGAEVLVTARIGGEDGAVSGVGGQGVGVKTGGGQGIVVTVQDRGPGIPEARLETIFDRFYSERPAGEKFGTHSGLGLSISKQIVDAHRGQIFATNRRDENGHVQGAVFTVILPVG